MATTYNKNHRGFTRSYLLGLKPADKTYVVWDGGFGQNENGMLGCRVPPSGRSVIFVQYRLPDGSQSKFTLGRVQDLFEKHGQGGQNPMPSIRKVAKDHIAMSRNKNQMTRQIIGKTNMTLAEFGEIYLADRIAEGRPYADDGCQLRYVLKRATEALPVRTPMSKLTLDDVTKIIIYIRDNADARLASKNGHEIAARCIRLIKPMVKAASIRYEIPGVRPSLWDDHVGKGKLLQRSKPRERVLTLEEREKFEAALNQWAEIDGGRNDNRESADLLRLLLSTGARQGEWFASQWNEIDFEKGTWWRPAQKRKMREGHEQYLSPSDLEILNGLRQRQLAKGLYRKDGYIFPASKNGSEARLLDENVPSMHRTTVTSAFKRVLRLAGLSHLGEDGVKLHDLRATAVSHWEQFGDKTFEEIGRHIGSNPDVLRKHYGRPTESKEELAKRFFG